MVVPTFSGPSYGRQYAQQQAANDQTQGSLVAAQLDLYGDVIRGLMQNAERVASVSGSGALDRIAGAYAGAQGPLFGGDYAAAMDSLRQSLAQAEVGAVNRRGRGGGGGGASTVPENIDTDEMVIQLGDMPPHAIRASEYEQYELLSQERDIPLTVLQAGRPIQSYNDGAGLPNLPGLPQVPAQPATTPGVPRVDRAPVVEWQIDENGKRFIQHDDVRIYEDGS